MRDNITRTLEALIAAYKRGETPTTAMLQAIANEYARVSLPKVHEREIYRLPAYFSDYPPRPPLDDWKLCNRAISALAKQAGFMYFRDSAGRVCKHTNIGDDWDSHFACTVED